MQVTNKQIPIEQQLQTTTNKTTNKQTQQQTNKHNNKHNNKQTQAKRKQSAVKNLRKTQDAHKVKSPQSVVVIGSLFEAFLS